jgi:hypothetical protein
MIKIFQLNEIFIYFWAYNALQNTAYLLSRYLKIIVTSVKLLNLMLIIYSCKFKTVYLEDDNCGIKRIEFNLQI